MVSRRANNYLLWKKIAQGDTNRNECASYSLALLKLYLFFESHIIKFKPLFSQSHVRVWGLNDTMDKKKIPACPEILENSYSSFLLCCLPGVLCVLPPAAIAVAKLDKILHLL